MYTIIGCVHTEVMSTSRAIRGTKVKVIFIFCVVFILAGILAGVHNILVQLVELKESNAICHQQEENLSTQLQVISDYKQRLEKTLKTEKAENQQKRVQFEHKLEEEKSKYDKQTSDATQKFNALKQHCNLIKTNHDDFKLRHNELVSKLEGNINELKEQIKNLTEEKERLKTKVISTQIEKENLQKEYEGNAFNKNESKSKINHLEKVNHELQRELDRVKEKCPSYDTLQEPAKNSEAISQNDKINPNSNNAVEQQFEKAVGNMPPVIDNHKVVSPLPNPGNVFAPPSKSTTKSGVHSSSGRLNGARPLGVPTVTPETFGKNHILFGIPKDLDEIQKKKVPEGVVPIPEDKQNVNAVASNDAVNNRYRNAMEGEEQKPKPEDLDKENGAHEEFDLPNQNKNVKLNNNAGYDGGLSFNENDVIQQAQKANFDKQHIDSLGVRLKDGKIYDQEKPAEYDLQNEVPLEENDPEEDDEQDEYGALVARNKDPAIRN